MFILSASKDPCILNWISVFRETIRFSCVLCPFLDPYIVFLRSELRQQILTPRPPSQCCHRVGKIWWKWRSAFQREENPTREDICTSTNCYLVKVLEGLAVIGQCEQKAKSSPDRICFYDVEYCLGCPYKAKLPGETELGKEPDSMWFLIKSDIRFALHETVNCRSNLY